MRSLKQALGAPEMRPVVHLPAQPDDARIAGRRTNIGSFRCKPGDVIEVHEKSKQLVNVLEAVQLAERDVPDYIEADHNKMVATYTRVPGLADVPFAVQMEPNLVVEFYSR